MIKELQIKMDKIYQDENNNFQFDFRNAEEVVVLDKLTHCIPELQYWHKKETGFAKILQKSLSAAYFGYGHVKRMKKNEKLCIACW